MKWTEMVDTPEQEKQKCAIELSPQINEQTLCEVWRYSLVGDDKDRYYSQGRLHHMIHGLMTFSTINSMSPEYMELTWLRELVSGGFYRC